MLSHVSIKHFQSLHDVSLELRPLTVIVGPSSSGKSAFTRALRTLTSNARGDSFITHGQNQCIITAKTDRGTVALLRGKKNEYVLIPENDHAQQKSFTKLAGNVPEEVSEFIGIPAKDPLNYSNQFDMPYLLTSSAAEVARTLGELTNVSVIFEASREANRRRMQSAAKLKTRAEDYQELTKNLEAYKSLKADLELMAEVEEHYQQAFTQSTKINRLEQLLARITDIPDVPEPVQLPDITEAEEGHKKILRLAEFLSTHKKSYAEFISAEEAKREWSERVQQAEQEYTDALKELGTCPTCGQSTEHVH